MSLVPLPAENRRTTSHGGFRLGSVLHVQVLHTDGEVSGSGLEPVGSASSVVLGQSPFLPFVGASGQQNKNQHVTHSNLPGEVVSKVYSSPLHLLLLESGTGRGIPSGLFFP